MAQVFDEHNIHFGIHLCIEQIGAEERRTFQIPLVEIVSGVDVNFISLLAASGSLVCVATEDESSYLIVLNLYNMGVVELDGLPPINFNADFGNWVHHTFRCVTDIDRMSFDISHVALPHHDFVPRRLELSLLNGNLIDMVHDALFPEQHEHFVEPVEGWNSTHHCLFGKDGYVVLFQTETSPFVGEVSRLKAICLYELSQDWDIYEHIGTVPGHMIPPNLCSYDSIHIEQSDNIVNITFIAPERDEDGFDDDLSCCILQFWYNLETGQWGSRYTPLHDLDNVYRVVVTPSLTVGLI
ncbi:hypothetical protein Tco_1276200 [Tanacetum coccineum]